MRAVFAKIVSLYVCTPYSFARSHLPAIVALLISVPFIMVFDRRTPRVITDAVMVPSPTKPGEAANLIFTATDYRRCTGITIRWIVDARGVTFLLSNVPVESSEELNVPHQFVRETPIPGGASIGPATYHAAIQRWCNPLQQFWPMASATEVKFDIVAK